MAHKILQMDQNRSATTTGTPDRTTYIWRFPQEGAGSITFRRHVQIPLKLNIWNPHVESFWFIYVWVQSEGKGGGVWGGSEFFGPPLQTFTGPLLQNFKYIIGILSSNPVDWHPLWAIWVKGGVCGHVQKSEAHALGCRPLGDSSQWSSSLPQTYRIVQAWDSQWNSEKWKQCGTVQVSYGCLVGHACMGIRISVFAP